MFIVLMLVVVVLARWLGGAPDPQPASADAFSTATQPRGAVPAAALALLALTGFLAQRSQAAGAPDQAAFTLPLATTQWQGPLPPASAWHPDYAAPDAERRASYHAPEGTVEVYANLYLEQNEDRELIRYGNNLTAPAGWERPWSARMETISSENATLGSFPIRGPAGDQWLLARAFVVGPGIHRHEAIAKLAYGWRSIWRASPSGVIAIAAPCGPANCDHAQALIADFWDNQQSRLQAMVPAGAGRAQ
jgi:hypothetical protein